jgi:hypothetical protein
VSTAAGSSAFKVGREDDGKCLMRQEIGRDLGREST